MIKKIISLTVLYFTTSVIIITGLQSRGQCEIISEARLTGVSQKFFNMYMKPLKGKKKIMMKRKHSYHKGSYNEIGRSLAKFLLKRLEKKLIEGSICLL